MTIPLRSIQSLVEVFQDNTALDADRDEAFTQITYRLRRSVLQKCEIICARFGYGVGVAEVVAENTFTSYYKKGRFDFSKWNGKPFEESFLIYLFSIADRELTNYYREEQRKINNPYNGSECIQHNLPDLTEDQLSQLGGEEKVVLKIIQGFSVSKRKIYLTYQLHQKPGFKMPRKLLAELRQEVGGVEQATVNGYLKEARDEIAQGINIYKTVNDSTNER